MSVTVTAALAGITREYLHRVEAGKQVLTIPKLHAIADGLGVRPVDLLPAVRPMGCCTWRYAGRLETAVCGPIEQEYGALEILREIRVQNTSEATLDRTEDGGLWVSKNLASYNEFAAEALAYTVGLRLRVRIPECKYKLLEDGTAQWLSRYVDPVGQWEAELVSELEDLEDLARVVVLDNIIGNNDRHANNLLLEHLGPSSGIRLHAIDHESAHVGTLSDLEGLEVAPTPHQTTTRAAFRRHSSRRSCARFARLPH